MLKGGYISFMNAQGTWQQILWVEPGPPQLRTLGVAAGARSWRESVHGAMGDVAGRAKHDQRHKAGGMPELMASRVQAHADCDREAYGQALEAKRGWLLD